MKSFFGGMSWGAFVTSLVIYIFHLASIDYAIYGALFAVFFAIKGR